MSPRKKLTIAIAAVAVILAGGYGLAKYGAGGGRVSADSSSQLMMMSQWKVASINVTINGATPWVGSVWATHVSTQVKDSSWIYRTVSVENGAAVSGQVSASSSATSIMPIPVPTPGTNETSYKYSIKATTTNSMCSSSETFVDVTGFGSYNATINVSCNFSSAMGNLVQGVSYLLNPGSIPTPAIPASNTIAATNSTTNSAPVNITSQMYSSMSPNNSYSISPPSMPSSAMQTQMQQMMKNSTKK
ncbi:MAG: hypothetical protein NTW79_03040 [Candidatus Berkelbacteria bacterium]|nr:hypothetical protein [Candidatus Berkelbacteria bacterium]